MTARLSLLFALVLGWACAAQANLPDRAFNTQTQTTDVHATLVACGPDGDGKGPPP